MDDGCRNSRLSDVSIALANSLMRRQISACAKVVSGTGRSAASLNDGRANRRSPHTVLRKTRPSIACESDYLGNVICQHSEQNPEGSQYRTAFAESSVPKELPGLHHCTQS